MNAAYPPDCRIWSLLRLVESEIVAWHAEPWDQLIKFWCDGIFPKKMTTDTKDGWTDSRQFSSHVCCKFAIKARATAAVAWCDRPDHRLSYNLLQNKIHHKSFPSLRDKKTPWRKKAIFCSRPWPWWVVWLWLALKRNRDPRWLLRWCKIFWPRRTPKCALTRTTPPSQP